MKNLAADIDRDFLRQVAVGHGDGDFGDVAHLAVKLPAIEVDAVGKILPSAAHARHNGLAAQLAFGADFARDAGDFRGKGVELIDHGVDGFLELKNLAIDVDGDFLRQVAVGHGDRDIGDVAHLGGRDCRP